MAKQKQTLEWKVLGSDAEWEQRYAPTNPQENTIVPDLSRRRLPLSWMWAVILVALLLFASGAYWLWREAQSGLERINAELTLAVETEIWRTQFVDDAADDTEANSIGKTINSPVPPGLLVDGRVDISKKTIPYQLQNALFTPPKRKLGNVEIGELTQGIVRVEVTTIDKAGNMFQETHFYRDEEENGWRHTLPDESFWGAERKMETTHLRWLYRAHDEAAVQEVAQALDQFYIHLSQDLGLPLASPDEKLPIKITTATPNVPAPNFDEDSLVIVSPLLLVTPAHQSEAEVLYARALFLLLQHTLHLLEKERPIWCVETVS